MANQIYGDRWRIIEPISEGGQAQVFKVEDIQDNNKIYVLKRLKNINRIERFRNEIESIKRLTHPNIVKLIESNLITDKPYLVTEFCVGGEVTFNETSKLSTIEKLILFSSICKAIGYAHENKIIHRDIKPANILFNERKMPVISDFGICFNSNEGFERLTETIEQVGARFFMAPELADGRSDEITPRSDVYSLGKLLYWLVRGKVFDREKFSIGDWDLRKDSKADHTINFIYEIFEKTIIENPQNRFEDANQLANEVDKIIEILEKNGHFLDISLTQKCLFCAKGEYEKFHDPLNLIDGEHYGNSREILLNYQLTPQYVGNRKEILYLICNHCGNIQIFRLEKLKNQTWKGELKYLNKVYGEK